MKEKLFFIEPAKARELLARVGKMTAAKHGIDSSVYLIDEFAVLTTSRMKLRNVATRDDDLAYFEELIHTLMDLERQGIAVVPILGYSCDMDSKDGNGYIFQTRAKGEELYNDAAMSAFYVWTQSTRNDIPNGGNEYLIARTSRIATIPQAHFDKFISDIIALLDNDILIDFNGKSNFFYDDTAGFQFIDLDSHTDYKYGLTASKPDSRLICAYYGFAPCHLAVGTRVLPNIALAETAVERLDAEELQQLIRANTAIFEKCKTAMLNSGISAEEINRALELLRIFGVQGTLAL